MPEGRTATCDPRCGTVDAEGAVFSCSSECFLIDLNREEVGRRAPVQRDDRQSTPGTVAWWEHEAAYADYKRRCPGSAMKQSAERLAQRGGFSYGELLDHLGHAPTTWSAR